MWKKYAYFLCVTFVTNCLGIQGIRRVPKQSTQPPPSPTTSSEQCNGGYLLQGPLVGPPGRDGVAGRDGLPVQLVHQVPQALQVPVESTSMNFVRLFV